jgi:putative DNA primase/helicase
MSDAAARAAKLAEKKLSPPIEVADARPPAFSDEALALGFAKTYRDELRYVAAWSKWMIYGGGRWVLDETLKAFNLSRVVCRKAAAECNTKAKKTIASAKTVAAVERLAKADRRLAATTNQWDPDDFLLNTILGEDDDR